MRVVLLLLLHTYCFAYVPNSNPNPSLRQAKPLSFLLRSSNDAPKFEPFHDCNEFDKERKRPSSEFMISPSVIGALGAPLIPFQEASAKGGAYGILEGRTAS